MQVLLRKTNSRPDLRCTICHQGFHLFWERSSRAERETMRAIVSAELRRQHSPEHADDQTTAAHPSTDFNLPEWAAEPRLSGAALYGGVQPITPRTSQSR